MGSCEASRKSGSFWRLLLAEWTSGPDFGTAPPCERTTRGTGQRQLRMYKGRTDVDFTPPLHQSNVYGHWYVHQLDASLRFLCFLLRPNIARKGMRGSYPEPKWFPPAKKKILCGAVVLKGTRRPPLLRGPGSQNDLQRKADAVMDPSAAKDHAGVALHHRSPAEISQCYVYRHAYIWLGPLPCCM